MKWEGESEVDGGRFRKTEREMRNDRKGRGGKEKIEFRGGR